MSAATGWDIRRSAPAWRRLSLTCVTSSQLRKIWKFGSLPSSTSAPSPRTSPYFGAVEFCLWDAMDDSTNFQRNYSVGEVEVENNVIYHKTEYRERRNHFAYFTCSEPLAGFDTQRDAFLGPYRGWDAPIAVETGQSSGSIAHGWQPVGAQHIQTQPEIRGKSIKLFFFWDITKIRKRRNSTHRIRKSSTKKQFCRLSLVACKKVKWSGNFERCRNIIVK